MKALDHELLEAARTGDAEGVRAAIEGGARADVRDEEPRTPLLAAGATPGLPDGDGVTAPAHAGRRGHMEIAALLRDAGGDR
ncbi:hypothetical protein ACTU45_19500 [Streptomyces sp. 24-1644]|uniref:hypothetical protein n=1 Tax=Streptomyces sp. 24-1644 TaxID=3457315 RepID=UPI003FA69C73